MYRNWKILTLFFCCFVCDFLYVPHHTIFAASPTPIPKGNFIYLGCYKCNTRNNVCPSGCNELGELTDKPDNMCDKDFQPMCGYNQKGIYEGGQFLNICSCVKKSPLIPTPQPNSNCTCAFNQESGYWEPTASNCPDDLPAQCADSYGVYGSGCMCLPPGTIKRPGEDDVDPYCTKEGFGSKNVNPSIRTAVGCIPVRTADLFVGWLLPKVFAIIGGITFLLLVYGFILFALSKGDEKVIAGAKATITSAIMGLLFSIFALFILRLIAVNILNIPGIS